VFVMGFSLFFSFFFSLFDFDFGRMREKDEINN
jgi:preprotein translocase subunit SecE